MSFGKFQIGQPRYIIIPRYFQVKYWKILFSKILTINTCHWKRKGKYFLHYIKPNFEHIEISTCCRGFPKMDWYASNIIFSSRPLQTSTFYHLISMDHKRSVSLMISSLGMNRLFHMNGNWEPTTKNHTETDLTTSHNSSQRLDMDSGQD